jgi:surfeit locus 1 family protein
VATRATFPQIRPTLGALVSFDTVMLWMSRYRFLTRPSWILFHVVVVLLVILMVNLSFWQLRRLHERRSFNSEVRARTSAAAQPFDSVVPPGTSIDAARLDEWMTVNLSGTFDPSAQILIRNRTLDGAPGFYILTPLRRPDGTAVLVVRGWIPLTSSNSSTPDVPPPAAGPVTIDGRVRPTQNPGALASRDPADGILTTMARVDIPRVQQQTSYPLAPAYVEMSASTAAPSGALPVLVPLPVLDDGPHLGYAVQWIIFSICAIVGWFVLVRKSARAREQKAAAAAAEAAEAADTVPV